MYICNMAVKSSVYSCSRYLGMEYHFQSQPLKKLLQYFFLQAEDSVDDDVLNSFCWMYSSFDMPSTFKFPCTRKTPYDGNHDTTYLYNTYYQWVSIFLAFQAGLFYIPRCIWLIMEGGLMAFIVNGMKIIISKKSRIQSRKKIDKTVCVFFVDFSNCSQTL